MFCSVFPARGEDHIDADGIKTALVRLFQQVVAEAAAGPAPDEEANQASAQELQSLRDSLNQADEKTRDLEGQLDSLNKVNRIGKPVNREHPGLSVLHIHVDECGSSVSCPLC